jgi:uncharacterized protein YutE (UPF0331/DUF86 family)
MVLALTRLRQLASLGEEAFLTQDRPAAAESYLRRALEAMFDAGRHIVAKRAGKAAVEYREIAGALAAMGVISEARAERLRLMAGYRNRLVHFYHEISEEELYTILRDDLDDLGAFVQDLKAFLEAVGRGPTDLR